MGQEDQASDQRQGREEGWRGQGRGGSEEESEKQTLKYAQWHEQKPHPQRFHIMLRETKKKINEEKKKSASL